MYLAHIKSPPGNFLRFDAIHFVVTALGTMSSIEPPVYCSIR